MNNADNMMNAMPREKSLILAMLALLLIMALSAIHPYDRTTWFMEVAPIFIALPVMIATFRRFPLTTLLYVLIFIHALVLIAGGHYTYARVPLGFWIEHAFSLSRNPYDKIGHFMQGFVPFLVTREILLRGGYLTSRRMAAFLSVCVAMAISVSGSAAAVSTITAAGLPGLARHCVAGTSPRVAATRSR